MVNKWGNNGNSNRLYFLGLQNHCRWWFLLLFLPAILIPACASSSPAFLMMYFAYKLKRAPRGYGWEVDYKESWAPKNWCFWTVALEKTLESPLDCKEIQLGHSEGDQPWDFFGRNDAEAEAPVLWPHHARSWLIGKDSDAGRDGGRRRRGRQRMRWLDGITVDGRESEWTPGVGDGQGGLACCNSWGRRVGHDWVTELMLENNIEW